MDYLRTRLLKSATWTVHLAENGRNCRPGWRWCAAAKHRILRSTQQRRNGQAMVFDPVQEKNCIRGIETMPPPLLLTSAARSFRPPNPAEWGKEVLAPFSMRQVGNQLTLTLGSLGYQIHCDSLIPSPNHVVWWFHVAQGTDGNQQQDIRSAPTESRRSPASRTSQFDNHNASNPH